MKKIQLPLILSLFLLFNGNLFASESNLNQISNSENPLTVQRLGSEQAFQFMLSQPVKGDQGILVIATQTGEVILSEEVEILNGVVFKTLFRSELVKANVSTFIVTLKTEQETFSLEFSI